MKSPLKANPKSNFLKPFDFNKGSKFSAKNNQPKFNPSQFRTQHKGGS